MANGDRWSARYDHAIREGWPNAHSPKPVPTEEEKREAAKLKMRQRRGWPAPRKPQRTQEEYRKMNLERVRRWRERQRCAGK